MARALIIRVILVVLVLALLLAAVLYFAQDGMIYGPRPYRAAELAEIEADGLRRLAFETDQGGQVAFYAAPEAGGDPESIWLVFGGNGGRAADYREVAAADVRAGYLFIDYPGYGLCEGSPTPARIDASVDGAIAALGEGIGMAPADLRGRLCACGHSLGAAVALRAAARHGIGRLVLVAPFTTMRAMASRVVGGFYANVLRHRFDNVAALQALVAVSPAVRVTVINGTDDWDIPPSMGRELAGQFEGITEYEAIAGAGHNDIFSDHLEVVLRAMGRGRGSGGGDGG